MGYSSSQTTKNAQTGQAQPPELQLEFVYSPGPRRLLSQHLAVASGTTLGQALKAATQQVLQLEPTELVLWQQGLHTASQAQCLVGVWGRKRGPEHLLRDGDRIEIYRPLQVDPKEARRLRQAKHRSKPAQPIKPDKLNPTI